MHPPSYKQMEEFGLALDSCNLTNMGFGGYPFTWNNKRPGKANTKERLDRVVANSAWRETYPASTIVHLFSHASDHCPIVLQTKTDNGLRVRGVRGFKFEEAWLLSDDCEKRVDEVWKAKGEEVSSAMAKVKERILTCGEELLVWGSSRKNPKTEEIKRLQRLVENLSICEPTEAIKAEFLEASRKLDAFLL